jgi:signal transduction histidine kinase
MAELIHEGGTQEELEEYWRTLQSELNRQKILIDRLLIAGRLESGMMTLEHTPIDLIPVLEESIMAVKAIANKRRVVLDLKTERRPVFILGDKSGLQQVFINLINNAAKFSPEGSSVTINVVEAENEVRISISDQGLGIPPEAQQHLFERFYRAKNVTIAEIPGSGIGLYIVKSIVDELGGRINVKSELNMGTTFIISLRRSETR